ncbi:MAG: ferritin [bacterium]
MLITKNIANLINQQIGHEFGAATQYVAMAAYFTDEGLSNLARYFYKQAEEENKHALKFIKYLGDTATPVEIPAIPQPINKFKSAEEAIQAAYNSEMRVTKQIEAILALAVKESNYFTQNFLQWFINEQLEEVSSMDYLLKLVQRAGEKGLLQVDAVIAREGHPEDKD